MTSMERVKRRLRGESVDRVPNFNIMMQFAAQHLGQPLSRYYLDYRVLCAANFAVQRDFSLDILQAISDPYREAADLGLKVHFPENGLPVAVEPLLKSLNDMTTLRHVPPLDGARMRDRIAAIRLFRQEMGGKVPIMGLVEGALAEAANLRGVNMLLMDLFDQPQSVKELLEFCCLQEIEFAKAQLQAGADFIGLGDAIASQISPDFYREFALPYERRIFAAVHERGGLCRLHICGNTTGILDAMPLSGADIIDIDWMVDMGKAAQCFGTEISVCGNQDPIRVMLHGDPELVRQEVYHCVRNGGTKSFNAAGCEIPLGTSHENLMAQVRALLF